jgi:uncharacterized protein (DUF4415 family)
VEEAKAPAGTKTVRKRTFVLGVAKRFAGALLALPLLVIVASFFADEPLRRSIERRMNDHLDGYEVRVPKLRLRLFSLSMALEGLVVRQKAHPEPPVLRIEGLVTSVHWRALFSGHLVADILLVRPQIDINLAQLRQEKREGVPVNERGWQEALQEITPLKIDLFRVEDGTVSYVDADPAHPIRMSALRIVANDIRNIHSKPLVYPSPIHAEATLFESGHGTLDGHADFLSEPYPGFHALFRLDAVPLEALSLPVLAHTAFVLKGGVLAARGELETSPTLRNARLSELTLADVRLDYVDERKSPAEPAVAAGRAEVKKREKNGKSRLARPPELQWTLRLDKAVISGSEFGFVNRTKDPAYRAYLSRLDGSVSDLGNRASGARAHFDLRGQFLGSGNTRLTGSYREAAASPDFDVNLKIESTDMTRMNDLLRAYGKFDVVAGEFSFYSELKARDGRLEGYVKPLFKGMKVYDRRQDGDKTLFRQLYERLVGGVAGLLKNSERKEVATVANVSGRIDGPRTSGGWQIAVRLIENAFFRSILPGFDRELLRPAKKEAARGVRESGRSRP